MSVIKLETSLEKKRETKKKREAKFLEIHEIRAFFETLSQRRNPNYYDLVIVLLFSGLRFGEAAFTKDDFDAILRAILRSEEFDLYAIENPCEAFTFSESVF